MTKKLLIALTALAVLVPSRSAQAASPKSKPRFDASSTAVAENAGVAHVAVTRSPRTGKSKSGTNTVVSVAFASSNGTAVAGSDYTAVSGRLTFPACSGAVQPSNPCLRQVIDIPITDDAVVDGNKTVKLALTSPTRNAVVTSPQKTVLTIADNEGPNRITLDAS